MEQITLAAKKRERVGKTVKKLRSNGIIPGVLYGHNVETTHVELNDRDFKKAFKQGGENTIISLVIDGKTQPVLIHEVQHHYLRGEPIHVDFFAVNMTEKLNATIPLNFVGESMAVKATGGVLVKN
ncbi:MAG TPA: 50S ribosomal protein L25, partial [Coxiellaceae bacterium]|nr:50S ribosomal protein L25 [Coxiellaceae bacterium]